MGLDKDGINRAAKAHGIMLSAVALDRILELKLNYEEIFKSAKNSGEWFISPQIIDSFIVDNNPAPIEKKPDTGDSLEAKLEILIDSDVTGKSTCSGVIQDFIDYFNIRYINLKKVIEERIEYRVNQSIEQLMNGPEKTRSKIIVMVKEKRESNSGKRFLYVEDPSGNLTVMISDKDDLLKKLFDRILEDEVIGIEGVRLGDLFIANEIVQPDVPISHIRRYANEEVYAAFLSDIHVGSYLFMEKEFQKFIDWINGRGNKNEIASKIKYIFIAGDLVDGVGIYPGQDRELTIPDIAKQYEFLHLLISEIPDNIQIVCSMGNHDAVRVAEPQPTVPKEIAPGLHSLPNVHMCGNPVYVKAHGVRILIYHGTSLDMIMSSLSGCSYSKPETGMIEYLIRRNLVPSYGKSGIVPENKDYLFIDKVPDVFHCGHVHTNGFALYHGVNIINSGTWQGKTEYQEKLGHQPTPGIVPIMNLQNHEVSMLDFNGGGDGAD